MSKRDFALLMHKARLEDGTVVLLAKSIVHEKVPESTKYVRGEIIIGGWLLHAVDEHTTRVTFVACMDLRGSIPSLIKKQLDRKQPGLVNAIKPLLAKRMDELAKMKDADQKAKIRETQLALVSALPVYTDKELQEARDDKTPSV